MNSTTLTDAPANSNPASGLARLLNAPRYRYTLLQSLVGIMLSYQLLYGEWPIVSRTASEALVMGFMLMILAIVILPRAVLESAWLPSALITVNTVAVTGTIYLSGNARSELYFSYFLLVLIAASARTLGQMLGLSLIICMGYGTLLYEGVLETGVLSVGHLLGIPVLLVMAVFYGVTLENLTLEQTRQRRAED